MRVPRGPGRLVAALVAALWLTLLGVAPVSAHAELVSSDPEANASLAESPEALGLSFTEPLDLANASVELLDPTQQPVAGVGEAVLADQGRTLTVTLPELEPGVYVVSYQVLSTVDGHVTSGTLAPGVNQPIAMAYLAANHAQAGHEVYAEVRGKRYPMRVASMPFAPHRYHRG